MQRDLQSSAGRGVDVTGRQITSHQPAQQWKGGPRATEGRIPYKGPHRGRGG